MTLTLHATKRDAPRQQEQQEQQHKQYQQQQQQQQQARKQHEELSTFEEGTTITQTMATINAADWRPGFDEYHRPCWQNKVTGARVFKFPPSAPRGLSADNGTGPNLPTATQFTPAEGLAAQEMWQKALAGAWTEYHDPNGTSYWFNTISGKTTWDRPDLGKPTPPPPPPPPPPVEPTQTKKTAPVNEKDQWKQVLDKNGRKMWHNETTGKDQYDTPDICMNLGDRKRNQTYLRLDIFHEGSPRRQQVRRHGSSSSSSSSSGGGSSGSSTFNSKKRRISKEGTTPTQTMATYNAGAEWTLASDQSGRPCWYNPATGSRVYSQLPPAVPTIATATPFQPATGNTAAGSAADNWNQAVATAWTEYKAVGDDGKKKSYWHNPMSGQTTWDKPDMNPGTPTASQPPPPPGKGAESKKPASDEKESDKNLWKQVRDGKGRKCWYHETTGQIQYETPPTLMKGK
eukprot:g11479.t1